MKLWVWVDECEAGGSVFVLLKLSLKVDQNDTNLLFDFKIKP